MGFSRKRRSSKRRRTRKRPKRSLQAAIKKVLLKTSETKSFPWTWSVAEHTMVTATTPNYIDQNLTGLTEGNSDHTRIGDSVFCTSVWFEFFFTRNTTDTWATRNRIILYMPIGDVNLGLPATTIHQPINRAKYRVFYDKVITMDPVRGSTSHVVIKKKFSKPLLWKYDSSGGSSNKNRLKFMVFTDQEARANGGQPCSIGWHSFVYFKDP